MGIPDHLACLLRNLYSGQEATVRTRHETTVWFNIGKGVCQGYILSPCLFNWYAEYIMWNARLDEAQAGIKIARRNINNFRHAESEEQLKSLLMKVKGESEKASLKLNIQKTKILASDLITSWQIDREKVETVTNFIFLGSTITVYGECSYEIKRCLLLGRKSMTSLDSVLKSRDITLLTKVCLVKAMVFPVVMCIWENWTIKKAESQSTDAFELWCWRRLLRILWTSRRSNQSILKENNPWLFIGRTDAEAEAPILWPFYAKTLLIWKDSVAGKDWGARGEGSGRGWDGPNPSLTQWVWVEQTVGDSEGHRCLACWSPWGHKELDTT